MATHAAHLRSTQILDCQGRVRFTLTLRPDGDVEIAGPSVTVIVDPGARTVLRPPGVTVDADVLDRAATLARSPFG